jgi:hypothetical protein
MLNHGPVVSDIRPISEHDLNAVSVKVEYCRIEVAVFVRSGRRCTIGTTSTVQRCSVEVPNSGSTGRGESDMRGASFYTFLLLVALCVNFDWKAYSGVSWQRKKSASRIPKPTWPPDCPMYR